MRSVMVMVACLRSTTQGVCPCLLWTEGKHGARAEEAHSVEGEREAFRQEARYTWKVKKLHYGRMTTNKRYLCLTVVDEGSTPTRGPNLPAVFVFEKKTGHVRRCEYPCFCMYGVGEFDT